MSSILLSNTRFGTRGEYLAHYLLSGTGTVIQVPRQEDTGIDFHCTIGEIFGYAEKFHEHFYIQLKSSSDVLVYGNIEKKRENFKWKNYELDWLFNLQNPFFIGICNSNSQTLELYSTSFIWHPYYTQKKICQIKLLPNEPSAQGQEIHARHHITCDNWQPEFDCENKGIEVPLGPPIITITMDDLKRDTTTLESKRVLLKKVVQDERINIFFRQLKTPYFTWPHIIWTNNRFINGYFYAIERLIDDESKLLSTATPMLLSLGLFYKNLNNQERFLALRPALKLLPKEIIPENIKRALELDD